jgi:hypothetical protein
MLIVARLLESSLLERLLVFVDEELKNYVDRGKAAGECTAILWSLVFR